MARKKQTDDEGNPIEEQTEQQQDTQRRAEDPDILPGDPGSLALEKAAKDDEPSGHPKLRNR